MKTTEYLMMRRLDKYRSSGCFQFIISDLKSDLISNYETEGVTVRILKDTVPFGSFSLLPYSNGDVYFYDFELFPENRGHGDGSRVFPEILNYLYGLGYKNIRLQVSSSNPAALALYKHFDFKVIDSVTL